MEAVAHILIGEHAAHGDGAVSVDLDLGDVDGRLGADDIGEGAGRLTLLEVAVTEYDLGVVDVLARHALRQYDEARGGDVVVNKCRHVFLLSALVCGEHGAGADGDGLVVVVVHDRYMVQVELVAADDVRLVGMIPGGHARKELHLAGQADQDGVEP